MPLLSVVLSTAAWLAGPAPLGAWVFVPAILDPGTWVVLLLPYFALREQGTAPPPQADAGPEPGEVPRE